MGLKSMHRKQIMALIQAYRADLEALGVIEGSLGFLKGDAVFLFVLLGFAIVPFKADVDHTLILIVC
jgi:hypothetical protein